VQAWQGPQPPPRPLPRRPTNQHQSPRPHESAVLGDEEPQLGKGENEHRGGKDRVIWVEVGGGGRHSAFCLGVAGGGMRVTRASRQKWWRAA